MKKLYLLLFFTFYCIILSAQITVLSYPFTFSTKRNNAASFNKGAYVAANNSTVNMAFILQDIDKADYVLASSGFKILSSFSLPAVQTIFNYHASNLNQLNFVGVTSHANSFNFVYKNSTTKLFGNKEFYAFKIEVVDFDKKNVMQKDFIDVPKKEKLITGFSEYNKFYLITVNDESSSLNIYTLSGDGTMARKTIPFPLPAAEGKKRKNPSDYLSDIAVINSGKEPDLEDATKAAKLFTSQNELSFVVNNGKSVQVVSINTGNFSSSAITIENNRPANDKVLTNAYMADNRIFLMQVESKKITITVFDKNGKNVNQVQLDETNLNQLTNRTARYEEKKGKTEKEESLDEFSQVIKALQKGTIGLSVEPTTEGRYLITAGTFDFILQEEGGGSSQRTSIGYGQASPGQTQLTSNAYSYSYTVPGVSKFVSRSNYYKSASFRLLMDTVTLKPVKGKMAESSTNQIRNYINEVGGSMQSQFIFNDKQYFGHYDKEAESYLFNRIPTKNK